MRSVSFRFAFSLTIGLGLCSIAQASFEVSPFILKLRADRGVMSGWFEVKPNQDKRPVAVELKLFERVLDINGVETQNSSPSQDLTIYPSELVVYPGEKVKVQAVWSGKALPVADRTYTLVAEEVPINVNQVDAKDKLEIGFKTLIRYRIVIAVETGKRGNLSVHSSKKIGADSVEIVVENKGAGRIPMEGFHLLIGGKKYADFPGIGNAIMPGDRRRFVLSLQTPPSPSEIRFGASDGLVK